MLTGASAIHADERHLVQYFEENTNLAFKETRPFAVIDSATCISFQVLGGILPLQFMILADPKIEQSKAPTASPCTQLSQVSHSLKQAADPLLAMKYAHMFPEHS